MARARDTSTLRRMEPIGGDVIGSQLVVITAALGGLVITTLAIVRDIYSRRAIQAHVGAPAKP